MTLLTMVHAPDPRLKKISKEVDMIDDKLKKLMDDMIETMYHEHGVGLAAPQVGENIRVFVMDCSSSENDADEKETETKPYKFVNPKIVKSSQDYTEFEEGCLSLPEVRQLISRPSHVTVRYLDENANEQEVEFSGLEAVCVQHEIDHLDGKILSDYMPTIKRQLTLNKLRKWKKEHRLSS